MISSNTGLFFVVLGLSLLVATNVHANDEMLWYDVSANTMNRSPLYAPKFGISYTYRFGGVAGEEYGALNIKNFAGRNIPVIKFSSEGIASSNYSILRNQSNNSNKSKSGFDADGWMIIIGGVAVAGVLVFALDNGKQEPETACLPPPDNPFACLNK